MIRSVTTLLVLLGSATAAVAQPPVKPTQLTLRPAAAPVPALRYRLLPEVREQSPGNAAQLYYRAYSPEWQSYRRPEVLKELDQWSARQVPGPELRWVLTDKALEEVDRAAR